MPRRLLVFVLFVVGLVLPTIASARTPGYAGTRVGAFDLAVHVGVGLSVDQAAEKHRGIGFTCDEIASGSPHAAEGAGALRFSQTTASTAFSADGAFAGKTIGGLAADLRAGTVAASDVPVGYVNLGGNSLIVNTRSSLALTRAGIPQSGWTMIDMTATDGAAIQARLLRNGLTLEGTPTLRITGLGSGASSLE